MTKRVLAIGVGGSGKATLTILKERLLEAYNQVPDNVVLLSLDTDDLRNDDVFSGARLSSLFDGHGREPEFAHVVSPPGITMDSVFRDIARGRTTSYMHWLEHEKLQRRLGPSERDIRGGAQQRRPIGRLALFQRWNNVVYDSILGAIKRMYGEPEEQRQVDAKELEKSKRMVFIVGSVAGGTGSGFFIDVANLVNQAVKSNANWQSIDVSAVIVLPDAFSSYATPMEDPTNLKPNSYAALRELDRFIRVHGSTLPYAIRYGSDVRSMMWSTNQPVDHIYLVDTASRSASSDIDLTGNPWRGVFPLIADFIMAHVDKSLGDELATLRSNAGLHYDKEMGWQYSSFNILTYLFPANDVIKSFSYRFLKEMLARQFLPIQDDKIRAQIKQQAREATVRSFSENRINGIVNPSIIPKALASTKRNKPERPNMSWTGIALSDKAFAQDLQDLEQSLGYLRDHLIPSREEEYKQEFFDEGYSRILGFSEMFMERYLGPLVDPDDETSRFGGEWDKILSRYRNALRMRFAEALDAGLIQTLNQRHSQSKLLDEARLPYARSMVDTLKERLIQFQTVLEAGYRAKPGFCGAISPKSPSFGHLSGSPLGQMSCNRLLFPKSCVFQGRLWKMAAGQFAP